MEDILASIRRIIDEDEHKAPGASVAAEPVPDEDDDVLDLTETVEDEPDESEAEIWTEGEEVMPEADEAEWVDVEPVPDVPVQPSPSRASPPAAGTAASHEDQMTASNDDRLVSEAAYASAAAALGSLARASERDPLDGIQRGRPVEELVMDLLKPMLRDWLDQNLPIIVERVVEREVRYLSRRLESDDRA